MSEKALNKTEALIETAIQCLSWAEENKDDCHIEELEAVECFWENGNGMEFSTEENLFKVTEKLIDSIHELSNFINNYMDCSKCYQEGVPSLAIKEAHQ